jgi:uncharacterized protein Usg
MDENSPNPDPECDRLSAHKKVFLKNLGSMLRSVFFADFRQFSAKSWRFLTNIFSA